MITAFLSIEKGNFNWAFMDNDRTSQLFLLFTLAVGKVGTNRSSEFNAQCRCAFFGGHSIFPNDDGVKYEDGYFCCE